MKHILTVAGIVGILVLTLTAQTFAAGGVQAQSAQPGTPTPQAQSTPVNSASTGYGMGMRWGMMGSGMHRQMGMMGGEMHGHMGMTAGSAYSMPHEEMMEHSMDDMAVMPGSGYSMPHEEMMTGEYSTDDDMGVMGSSAYSMTHEAMMVGANPTHAEVAALLGTTTQDMYNQMASGKSLTQIATEKGITEQQLVDAMMAGRKTAFAQATQEGRITQEYADTMLKIMESNFKLMLNAPGTIGWGMMWNTQPSPEVTPQE